MAARNVSINLSGLPLMMNGIFKQLYPDTHRYLVLVGGAGSGKSYWAAQEMLARMIEETKKPHTFAIIRKVAKTQRLSTFQLFRNIISEWGLQGEFRVNKSDMTILFKHTGATLNFLGVDDPEKLKSITDITGIWIEEATELVEEDFDQIDLRLRGITPYYKQIMLTFNPISHLHWLKKRFFDTNQHGDTRTLRTTYEHNRFLDDDYRRKIELLKEQNPSLYRIYGRGEWGILEGLVYDPPIMHDTWPTIGEGANAQPRPIDIYGLDFGVNNPCALIGCALKDVSHITRRGDVYLSEELYETQLDTTELISRMAALKIPKATPIFGDSADPDRIKQIKRAGYNIKPAHKGPGSVLAGIDMCKSLTLHTLTRNTNLNAEFGGYAWGIGRDGNKQDNPVPFNDHALDAMRYALWTHLRQPQPEFIDRKAIGL